MIRKGTRRTFMKSALVATLGGWSLLTGLLKPGTTLAGWNQSALESGSVADGLKAAFGDIPVALSDKVTLKAPEIAADGSSVPITIEANLSQVDTIALFSEENPRPLASLFHPGPGVRAKVVMRVKMARTSDVIAVVKSNGRLYMARRKVTITTGGCA